MRTNIELDENLLEETFHYTHSTTKRAVVDEALREFVKNHRRKDIREVLGKVRIHADYEVRSHSRGSL